MSHHTHHYDSVEDPGPLVAPKFKITSYALIALGLLSFFYTLLIAGDAERAWAIYLQAMMVPFYIGSAALFFIAVNSLGLAHWIIPLRRLMEGLTHGLWVFAAMFAILVIAGGPDYLYDWYFLYGSVDGVGDHAVKHVDLFHVYQGTKATLMTPWRFVSMHAVIAAIFLLFQYMIVYKKSVAHDAVGSTAARDSDADEKMIHGHRAWGVAYLPFFAVSITFIVWDMMLSLHVNWFSTMWGVYCFTSAMQIFLCVLIILTLWLRRGPMKNLINDYALHDLGTWMVGWSCFCAYIAFSQFMLIYYANLDEETYWYIIRTQHGYGVQYVIEMFIRWPFIFLGLMSQSVRARPAALLFVSIVVLIANWMSITWIIQPAFHLNEYSSPFALDLLLAGGGTIGAFLAIALWFWKKHGLIPKGEPHLLSSINAEHRH